MALLDVSDILLDPDFSDKTLVCVRSRQAVGEDGIAVNTKSNIKFSGVVTSNNGDILERISTGERVKGSITIHSRFQLSDGGGTNMAADVVLWRGRSYTVSSVNDYAHFGRGFIVANCDLIEISG